MEHFIHQKQKLFLWIFRQFRNFVIIRKRASTKLVMLKTTKHLWRNVHRRVRIWPIKAYFFARWRFLKDYVYGHFCSLNSSDEWLRKNCPIHWLYILPWQGVEGLLLKAGIKSNKWRGRGRGKVLRFMNFSLLAAGTWGPNFTLKAHRTERVTDRVQKFLLI